MFISKIEQLATKKNISIAQMLKDLNMGQGTFSTWKTRGTIPNGETLIKLADYFGVTTDYLLREELTPVKLNTPVQSPFLNKYNRLDETDQIKTEAFMDGLLAADKYQEPTQKIKIAARGGGIKEITLTDSQLQDLLNSPDVTDLGNKS